MLIDTAYTQFGEVERETIPDPADPGKRLRTAYTYDTGGNLTELSENQQIDVGGAQTAAPRVYTYTFTPNLDQPEYVTDLRTTPGTVGDDERFEYVYLADGRLGTRTVKKNVSGSWVSEQSSISTYFDNGQLKTLTNKDGAGTTIESHTQSFLDGNNTTGIYMNGNKVTDTFMLKGPTRALTASRPRAPRRSGMTPKTGSFTATPGTAATATTN